MTLDGLDVIIRVYDTADLPLLDQCIFSLLGQVLPAKSFLEQFSGPMRVHLMLQRFSVGQMQEIRRALQPLLAMDGTALVTLHNWDYGEPFDVRVALLNKGVEVAPSRYWTSVNFTDVLLPGAFAKLLVRLRETEAALAIGGLVAQPVLWWGDVTMPDFAQRCFPPASNAEHGALPYVFLIDRARASLSELTFRLGEPDAEVADFIQHLRVRMRTDTAYAGETLGIRRMPN